ncbi:MAG TPA: LCP family protein [Acidimicrobiales bacterium]|nr:LCP family protein [Acidimicrobiales bacterium]
MELGNAVDQRDGDEVKNRAKRPHRVRRRLIISGVALLVVIAGVIGGSYYYANYRFNKIPKINVAHEVKPISGKPFNILMIGSDSRVGLSGILAKETGASTGTVSGQRSDVVKIIHVDPDAGVISMVSIPRDTVVTLLANQSLYGQFNRINVNFGNGPSLLAQTITANFGIPINQTIVVSFAGLINVADALGGVYLDFRYPAFDPESDLWIRHAGCQIVKGATALAVSRSRHYYYNVRGSGTIPLHWSNLSASQLYSDLTSEGWLYDGSSDFGRIDRQDAFLRAMIDQAKHLYNPLTLNSFLSAIPQGITLDSNFTLRELIGLAVRFHGVNANGIRTFTLPTVSAVSASLGDVLYVAQPAAQQQLVGIFGAQLQRPTNPPPNAQLQTLQPPNVAVTTTTLPTSSTTKTTTKKSATTATTNPTLTDVPSFDPTPCTPA